MQRQPMPITAEPLDAGPPLAYAPGGQYERVVLRLVGIIALAWGGLGTTMLVLDALDLSNSNAPDWVSRLLAGLSDDPTSWQVRDPLSFYVFVFSPVAERLLMPILFVGGIGCVRQFARTRWWLILWAVATLLLLMANYLTDSNSLRMSWGPALSLAIGIDRVRRILEIHLDLATSGAFPAIVLWLTTRRGVGALFQKTD